MALIASPKDGDWTSLRSALRKLASLKLGTDSTPTFAGLTLLGTLTLPYITEGSVLFAGPDGLISQNNANFSWNDATDVLTVAGLLDLNPAITSGLPNRIIDIENSTALTAETHWTGIRISGDNLDPSGVDTLIRGVAVNMSGVDTTNTPESVDGIRISMPIGNGTIHALHTLEGKIRQDFTIGSDAYAHYTSHDVILDAANLNANSAVHAIDIATSGGIPAGEVVGLGCHSYVAPIHQHIGTYTSPSQTEYAGRKTGGGSTWADGVDTEECFVQNSDEVYIGSTAKFTEAEVIMGTPGTKTASPTFWFNTAPDTWTQFFPSDDTLGFTQSGLIRWDSADLTTWTNDGDPGGANSSAGYWIKIIRTAGPDPGTPTPTAIKTGTTTLNYWDKDGNILTTGTLGAGATTLSGSLDMDGNAITDINSLAFDLAKDYQFAGSALNHLGLTTTGAGQGMAFQLFSADGDGKAVAAHIFGYGTIDGLADRHRLIVGWSNATTQYEIRTLWTDSGIVEREQNLVLSTMDSNGNDNTDQLKLTTDGNVSMSGNLLMSGHIAFSQVDENERIDSELDGYMDYRATIGQGFYIGGTEQVRLVDGIFGPVTDSDVDLGLNVARWKDLYVDSIIVTDNITVGGTVDGIDIATDVAANTTHAADSTQAHSDYLINDGNDSTSGTLTAAGFITAGNIGDGTYTNTVAQLATASINFVIDGGGAEIADGQTGHLRVPFACTIISCTMLADQSGSIVVDIWKDTYANFPPDNTDSITDAGTSPTISGATKSEPSIASWTVTIAAGDVLAYNVDSCTDIERCTIELKVIKDNA